MPNNQEIADLQAARMKKTVHDAALSLHIMDRVQNGVPRAMAEEQGRKIARLFEQEGPKNARNLAPVRYWNEVVTQCATVLDALAEAGYTITKGK